MSKIYVGETPISAVFMDGKRYGVRIENPAKPSNLVYSLNKTELDGATYIDSGIDLSQYDGYTVCIDAQFGDNISVQNLVDWMAESSPYPVWAIDMNNTIRLATRNSIFIESTTTERRRYVVRYDGNTYMLFSIKNPTGYNFTNNVATGVVNHTLIFGAYYNNGNINRYMHAGSIVWSAQVYSEALSDEQCQYYYNNGVI
jgi:hypothetical protein